MKVTKVFALAVLLGAVSQFGMPRAAISGEGAAIEAAKEASKAERMSQFEKVEQAKKGEEIRAMEDKKGAEIKAIEAKQAEKAAEHAHH